MENLSTLKEKFNNPPIEFRSAPFWSWNDRLSEEELVHQVRDMKERGMGGFFMHSREGLETEYMGPEWMSCVKATVKAAKEEGMGAWIYDEDRWPSGAAGGLVPAKGGDAFRAKGLTIEVVGVTAGGTAAGEYAKDAGVQAVFRAVVEGDSLRECGRLDKGNKWATGEYAPEEETPGENLQGKYGLGEKEVLLVFRREVSGPSEWFNEDAPADNLNPDSVKAFIDTTYEVYKKEAGDEFGKAVPGVFTDEPNIADGNCVFSGTRGWIPWTDGFREYFIEKRGYDILDFVPYIFFKGKRSPKIRHDYWRTVSDRFCEAYSKQLGEWCEQNNLAFTGHFLLENDLGAATRVSGSIMPHYRYQHVPGVDMLCEQTHENLTIKQCTSVANQYGRKRVLSETYGCSGWEFTFEGQKWVGDWQYVLGVNLRCQHLALYSLKGCRKRDFPPVFNYNTSWWKYNNIVEDYFARIGAVMSQGTVVRDVLVIHPASTAWSMMGCDAWKKENGWFWDSNIVRVNEYGEQFNDFIRFLLGVHYDFDLGDETIMEEKGRVEGNKIFINLAGYSVVVIPPVKTLFASTIKLLKQFMDEGGRVIAVEPLAAMIEGGVSDDLPLLFRHNNIIIAKSKEEVCSSLEKLLPRKISIRDKCSMETPELLYMLRDLPDSQSLFIVNNDRNNPVDADISVSCGGHVEEWDLLTGEIKEIGVMAEGSKVSFKAFFGPAGSRLYIINKTKEPMSEEMSCKTGGLDYFKPRAIHTALGPVCKFTRTMPNALTLDKCSFRTKGEEWSEETDVWQAQRKIRDILGMRQVYYNGLPQRYKWIGKPHPKDGTPVEFKFMFNVEWVPDKDVYLVLEAAKDYTVKLNASDVPNKPEGWFIDRAFDKIRLEGLKAGINELILSCGYQNRMEVEDCYIIGDFGVDVNRNIIKEPGILHFGDWCLQGYFHYCGSMIYHFDFDYQSSSGGKAVLELGDYSAVTAEVRVNGTAACHIPWRAANGIDITGFLADGINKIDIEVMGSPRNLFGPLHQAASTYMWTDWASFRREGGEYTPEYVVKPYGLFDQVNIYKE